ncbi:hypothetical protein VKT23_012009 [Stygiomarasmius scandens]|uniref:Protein-S-isoprenylcysteine O-methyltransferase n=1 Tax=Marasmiellus scandens TaxID=2682957 RepID=A0ABR1J8I8_9AGAR
MSFLKMALLLLSCISTWITMTSPNPQIHEDRIVSSEPKIMTVQGARFNKFVPITTWLAEVFLLAAEYLGKYHIWDGYMPDPDISVLKDTPPTFYLGVLCITLSAYIRYTCYRSLGEYFTFEVTVFDDHKLITNGPYSVVRHPGYASFSLYYFGLLVVWASRGSWIRESRLLDGIGGQSFLIIWWLLFTRVMILLLLRIPREDELMKKRFKEDWVKWSRKVPWKLVPGVY